MQNKGLIKIKRDKNTLLISSDVDNKGRASILAEHHLSPGRS